MDQGLAAEALVAALDATFRIVEHCLLDTWKVATLGDEIRRDEFGEGWVQTRGAVVQRVFAHDAWHAGQVVQTLSTAKAPKLDSWT